MSQIDPFSPKTLRHIMSDFTPFPLRLFSSEEKAAAPVLLHLTREILGKIYSIICNFCFLFHSPATCSAFCQALHESQKCCFFSCRSLGGYVSDVCMVSRGISNLAAVSESMEPTATSPFAPFQLFFDLFLVLQRVFRAHLSLLQLADSLLGFFGLLTTKLDGKEFLLHPLTFVSFLMRKKKKKNSDRKSPVCLEASSSKSISIFFLLCSRLPTSCLVPSSSS